MAHKKIRIPIETSIEVMEELGKFIKTSPIVPLNAALCTTIRLQGDIVRLLPTQMKKVSLNQ